MALKTPLSLYNTLSRQKEIFKPITVRQVGLYSCGPTVYDYAHIGNLRAILFYDLLRRALTLNGYAVKQVMNITDVDDKTIKASRAAGLSLQEFTRRYEEFFLADLAALNIERPQVLPRASEHIPEMVALVEKLLAVGLAYSAEDGIYFRLANYPRYGLLSPVAKTAGANKQERIKNDEYDKESAHDFALWKFHTSDDGEAFWQTSLGKGRPGWHI
ncbi:MAG: Cysteine-tRNA ligase, partial [Candidatus Giovannonibacteria bacterium GW2011_GWA2_53_7]